MKKFTNCLPTTYQGYESKPPTPESHSVANAVKCHCFGTPLLIAALPQCLPAGVVCWFELLRSVWVLVQVPALLIRPLYNVRELLGHLAWYHYTFLEVSV